MSEKFETLYNFNKVELKSYSKFVDTDLSISDQIAYIAKVSNPSNQMNLQNSKKLMSYLIKNKHWSPFEMVNIVLEIETTRDISRQILRHRSFSFQEFSQRYADPSSSLGFINRDARLQDNKNRQNSIETKDSKIKDLFKQIQDELIDLQTKHYNFLIEQGLAKEQARTILSEGLIKTKLYMSGSLRSWIHYIQVRTDPSTQKEHRDVATKCAIEISRIFPEILEFITF
jgi:thymidylate synthase (FAD)